MSAKAEVGLRRGIGGEENANSGRYRAVAFGLRSDRVVSCTEHGPQLKVASDQADEVFDDVAGGGRRSKSAAIAVSNTSASRAISRSGPFS